MVGNFITDLSGTTFEFHTMNANRLQLFQVYVQFEGTKRRFHMQRKDKGDFHITDIDKVPPPYRELESELNAAIKDYGKSLNMPDL
jgi:hypothetical protein